MIENGDQTQVSKGVSDNKKGIRDAGSTADFRILFEIFEILEIFDFFWNF